MSVAQRWPGLHRDKAVNWEDSACTSSEAPPGQDFSGLNSLSNVLCVCLAGDAEPSTVQRLRNRALQLCLLQRVALLAAPAQQSSADIHR